MWYRTLSLRYALRVFEVRASSSSPRLPLCQILFVCSLHCILNQSLTRTQSINQSISQSIIQLIWCPGNQSNNISQNALCNITALQKNSGHDYHYEQKEIHYDSYLHIFLKIIQCYTYILATLLQFNVGISWQDKVEVKIFNSSTTRQRQTAECQLPTVSRLFNTPAHWLLHA